MLHISDAPDVFSPAEAAADATVHPSVYVFILLFVLAGAGLAMWITTHNRTAAFAIAAVVVGAAVMSYLNIAQSHFSSLDDMRDRDVAYFTTVTSWLDDSYGLDVPPDMTEFMITQNMPLTVATDDGAVTIRLIPTEAMQLTVVDENGAPLASIR